VKVSAIVPILYGEAQLSDTLRGLAGLRDRIDLEILLIVDVPDPSREAESRARNDSIANEFEALALYRLGERGFGSALRHGFRHATGDVLIPLMADASEDPEDVIRLTNELGRGWDIVAGSRYMRGGRIVGNSPKQLMSHLYSVLVRLAGGPKIHDVSNAFKAYRRSIVESIPTVARSFDISVELTLKASRAGFRITEIPTVWTNRRLGRSNFAFGRELRNYARWLLFAAMSHNPFGRLAQRVSSTAGRPR
jgi:glycosyltransferase involved in cell wall biosynthesis